MLVKNRQRILNELEKRIELNWESRYHIYIDEDKLDAALEALEKQYIDLPRQERDIIDELLISPERFFDNFDDYFQILVDTEMIEKEDEVKDIGLSPTKIRARLLAVCLFIE